METGRYFHSECLGCSAYGIECEKGCEYSDNPNPCTEFTPVVAEYETADC